MLQRGCDGIRRRDFVQVGTLAGWGLSLSSVLRAADGGSPKSATADSVLFLNLGGGPSHLDTLDMKPDGPAETKGEFQPIDSNMPGVPVCEHLPKLATRLDRFALIRGISHTAGAHPQAQSFISTGNRPVQSIVYPSLGSVVAKEMPSRPDLPTYVAIPTTEWNAGYLGDAYAPLNTNAVPTPGKPFEVRGITLAEGLTVEKVNRRQQLLRSIDHRFRQVELQSQLLEALDQFGRQAHSMITSKRSREAFDVSLEPASIQKEFAGDEFSQGVLLGCRLVEAGVKFVTVTFQGWDTHTDNFTGHAKLLPQLDAGLSGMLAMMNAKGLLDRTLVVVMGEFGRTPKINVNVGRDHYPRVNWCLMTGGGVRPGQLIGGTDAGGESPDQHTDITPDDLAATIYHALGIDFHQEYHTATGRPVMIVPHGRVVEQLFS